MHKNKIIDGKVLSNTIINDIAGKIRKNNIKPQLEIILIGNEKESLIYVKKKQDMCNKIGININVHHYNNDVHDTTLLNLINKLNKDVLVNGILIQLPIPEHLNKNVLFNAIDYNKDVDGFHITNIGSIASNNREPLFVPCTALACMKILEYEKIELKGKNTVVIGKSDIVGLPISLLLLKKMATVTVCHIDTNKQSLLDYCKNADIIISACGQPEMIKKHWLKSGVCIIDIGINTIEDNTKKNGYRIVGDIDYNDVIDTVGKITPVPGGVGPMTIAMLIYNTFLAYKLQHNIS